MSNQFILSSNKNPFKTIKQFLSDAQKEIILILPYIKTETLQQILPQSNTLITIITSWRIQDLWSGACDLDLYPFTKEKSIKLFLNNRIHLKVFMSDWQRCIFGSSNLSSRGLGICNNYNYELNRLELNIDADTLLYFRKIQLDSILVNDNIYNEYERKLNDLPPNQYFQEPQLENIASDAEFLISALPMSRDTDLLFNLYTSNFSSNDIEATECAMHDVVLFNVPLGLTQKEFVKHLQIHFFNSPFIIKLLEYIDSEEKYFGQIKVWIQNNCTDVPIPSRRDLTGNIQVLYKWIVQLSDGKYLVDRPNYSEKIYRVEE